jgi:hypothetical protein
MIEAPANVMNYFSWFEAEIKKIDSELEDVNRKHLMTITKRNSLIACKEKFSELFQIYGEKK